MKAIICLVQHLFQNISGASHLQTKMKKGNCCIHLYIEEDGVNRRKLDNIVRLQRGEDATINQAEATRGRTTTLKARVETVKAK